MRFRFLSLDSCFHRCAFSVLSRILSLGLWDHDSQIAPQIMGSWLTDCPTDYEIVSHGLSLGLWVHGPQIVPRIVRSYPTDCPSVMRCTVFSDDFLFSSTFITISGTQFLLLSPCFLEIDFYVLWHLCVLSWCVRCLTPLWVPLRMAWLD